MTFAAAADKIRSNSPVAAYGQTVLVLQGGGALGAYQAGVYQALHEAGIEPDWIIGTSIGAINASLIAGNKPEDRLARLKQFWERVEYSPYQKLAGSLPIIGQTAATFLATATGVRGFFEPNPRAHLGPHVKLGAESAGYYSTAQLQETLGELVDFAQVNNGPTRLTVGAANVHTSAMHYFDSRDTALNVKHVMASGALPPAFPAIRIDGELYWDGGILSNTPVEAVFDDKPRKDSLVFAVHLWNPNGPEPDSILKVMNRQKDLQYSGRAGTHIARQRQIHRLRHIIAELVMRLPEEKLEDNFVREIAAYGCLTRMHVVRVLAPQVRGEDHARDIERTFGLVVSFSLWSVFFYFESSSPRALRYDAISVGAMKVKHSTITSSKTIDHSTLKNRAAQASGLTHRSARKPSNTRKTRICPIGLGRLQHCRQNWWRDIDDRVTKRFQARLLKQYRFRIVWNRHIDQAPWYFGPPVSDCICH